MALFSLAYPLNAAKVSGTVYVREWQSRQPAAGVRVVVYTADGSEVLRYADTDSAGRYALAGLPSTTILLSVVKPGYVSRSTISGAASIRLSLRSAPSMPAQDFDLLAGGVITGHVTDAQGEPLEGVQIELHAPGGSDTSGSSNIGVSTTDDTGAYRVFGLAPGRYVLLGRRSAQSAPALCRGCSVQQWADPIEVGTGSEVSGIDLRFEAEPTQGGTTAPPGNPSGKEPRGSISGLVVSAQSGEILRSATVRLTSLRQSKLSTMSTKTLPNGMFTFDHLAGGSYGLAIEKSGYEPQSLPRQIRLLENQTLTGVDVKLNRAPTISGRISGLDGHPVSGAEVSVYRLQWRDGRGVAVKGANVTSDDRGMYRLAKLPVGEYLLAASPPASANTAPKGELDFGTGRVFYSSASSPSQAETLTLIYGHELTEINLSLLAQETFSVSGVVADAETGGTCASCVIRAMNLDESYNLVQAQGSVAPGGTFRVRGLLPGSYRIVAEKNSWGRRLISSQIVQIANRDLTGLHLSAGVARAVAGRVVLESPPPADPKAPKVEMRVQFTIIDGIGPVESVPVESDGTFAVSNLSNEIYHLQIEGLPEGAYLRAVRSAGGELPAAVISAEAPLVSLELVVSFKSANLAGQVKVADRGGAEPPPVTAAVILVPRENQSPYLTSVHAGTHPDGGFQMSGVPPGSYTAFAFSRDSKLDWENPQVRQRLQSYGKAVTLEAGKVEVVELPLAPDDLD